MAERSGFFPYVEGDTNSEYDGIFLANLIHSLISNGIYNGTLGITASSNMIVTLPIGEAYINGYYYRNDSNISLTIANADGILNRKDTVVLRWDINTRKITVQVLQGTFASTPIAPSIVRTSEQYDLKLAEISIAAGATAITQANITDTRLNTTVCGIVHAVIDHIDTTTLYNQIQSDLANFKSANEAGFTAWMASIKDILGTDEAANLLNLINNKIVFSNTQPTGQNAGDIWNQTNSTNSSYIVHKSLGNNIYTIMFPTSNASFISTTDGSNVQAKLDVDNKITTYTCTTTGTVHALVGTGSNGKFLADANFVSGDTFTVGGTAKTATTQNGAVLDDSYFTSGNWVNFTYDGAKLGFKSAGGAVKYNVFCQPSEPPTKHGIWLKTAAVEAIKKIVFDTQPFAAGSWLTPSPVPNMSVARDHCFGTIVGNELFVFGGTNGSTNYLSSAFAYNFLTNVYRPIANLPSARFGSGCAAVGTIIYIFCGYPSGGTPEQKTVYAYDTVANTYTTKANFPVTYCYPVCSSYNGKVYVFYGTLAQSYNPANDTYQALANLPSGYSTSATVPQAIGDKIYIFGCGSGKAVRYNISDNTYTPLLASPSGASTIPTAPVGDKIQIDDYGNNAHYTYSTSTDTYQTIQTPPKNLGYGVIGASFNGKVYNLGGTAGLTDVNVLSLAAKAYPDVPTAVVHYLPNDFTHVASLITTKMCDYLPSHFKDAMLYDGTNLLYPEAYYGDGTQWIKFREAA